MNDKPVLTLNADVKTFTMPKVGRGAPSYPQVGGAVPAALLTGDTQVLIGGELKGTVAVAVDTIKAAVLAGAPADAVAMMLDAHKADIEEVAGGRAAVVKRCLNCGVEFEPGRSNQRCCSTSCRDRHNAKQYRARIRVSEVDANL